MNSTLTQEEEILLNRGILPKNKNLSKEQVQQWLIGAQNEYKKIAEQELKELKEAIAYVGKYKQEPSDDLLEACDCLYEFTKSYSRPKATEPFYTGLKAPNILPYMEILCDPILGFASQNQPVGRTWEFAEYALVVSGLAMSSKHKYAQYANFRYLSGPYNVEVGKGVEMEEGCIQKVWSINIDNKPYPDQDLLDPKFLERDTTENTEFLTIGDHVNTWFFQQFVNGRRIK